MIRIFSGLIALQLICCTVEAATISKLADTDSTLQQDVTTYTFSALNLNDSTDLLACVCCNTDSQGTAAASATWEGGAMTASLHAGTTPGSGDGVSVDIFVLANPTDDESGDLVVTFGGETVDMAYCNAIEFSGVDQSTPEDTTAQGIGNASPENTDGDTITTVTDGAFIFGAVCNKQDTTLAAASGYTETLTASDTSGSDEISVTMGWESIATAGAESFTASGHDPENDDMAAGVAALRPAADGNTWMIIF